MRRRTTAITSRADLVREILADGELPLLGPDPLLAELEASMLCLGWYATTDLCDPRPPRFGPSPPSAVVASLVATVDEVPELHDAMLSLALTCGRLAPGCAHLQQQVAGLAIELRARGARAPRWASLHDPWSLTEAWVSRDDEDRALNLVLGWRHELGCEHALRLLANDPEVEGDLMGIAVEASVRETVSAIREVVAYLPDDCGVQFVQVSPAEGLDLLRSMVGATRASNADGLRSTADGWDLLALAEARAATQLHDLLPHQVNSAV